MKTTMVTTMVLLAAAAISVLAPAGATPAACADPCLITANGAGYLPPVVEIASGARAQWISTDVTHVNAEGTGVAADETCFVASYGTGAPSEPVTFRVTEAGLVAGADGREALCGTAVALPAGGYTLAYYCVLHPLMRGALVVTTV